MIAGIKFLKWRGFFWTKKGDLLESDSNTHLTDFDGIKDFVVANWVKPSSKNSKKKSEVKDSVLFEFY